MRRLLILLNLFILATIMTSCVPRLSMLNKQTASERVEAENMIKEIVRLLEEKDSGGLRNLFSVNVRDNVDNLDEGIEYLLETYQGDSISFEDKLGSTSESNEYGMKEIVIRRFYLVETEEESYTFVFSIKRNDNDPDDNGLLQLRIYKQGDERDVLWIMHRETPGILWEDTLTPNDYLAGATRALSNSDNDSLSAIYSKEVHESVANFEEDIEDAITMFKGYADYDNFPDVVVLSIEKDGNKTIVKAECELETKTFDRAKDITYLIYFVYFPYEFNKENGGLYSMQICEKLDENSKIIRNDEAGIFYHDS